MPSKSRAKTRKGSRAGAKSPAPVKQSARIADRAASAAAKAKKDEQAAKVAAKAATEAAARAAKSKNKGRKDGNATDGNESRKPNDEKENRDGNPEQNPWAKQVIFGPGYQPPPGAATIPGFSPWAWPGVNPTQPNSNFNPVMPWMFPYGAQTNTQSGDKDKASGNSSAANPWQPPPGFNVPWPMPPFMWPQQPLQVQNGASKRKASPSETVTKNAKKSKSDGKVNESAESEEVDVDLTKDPKGKNGRSNSGRDSEESEHSEQSEGSDEDNEESDEDVDQEMMERRLASDAKRLINTARLSQKTKGKSKSIDLDWMKPLFQPGVGLSPLGAHIKDLGSALGFHFNEKEKSKNSNESNVKKSSKETPVDNHGFAISDTIKAIRASCNSQNNSYKPSIKDVNDVVSMEDDELKLALGNLMCNGLADHVDFPIIKKILKGEFVELDRLLPPTLEEIQKKSKKLGTVAYDKDDGRMTVDKEWESNQIKSFNQWSQAFDIYSSVYCISHPEERFDMLAYVRIIRNASHSMSGKVGSHHWLMYDRLFRSKKSKYPALSWATIDWEIFCLNVLLPCK